jgi:hypothetical protein
MWAIQYCTVYLNTYMVRLIPAEEYLCMQKFPDNYNIIANTYAE